MVPTVCTTQIDPGAEAASSPGKHHGPDVIVSTEFLTRLHEAFSEFVIQGIQPFRSVEGQDCHALLSLNA
jgi:hypothetical protein